MLKQSNSFNNLKSKLKTKMKIYDSYLPLTKQEEKMFNTHLNPIECFHSNRIEGNSYTLDETTYMLSTGYVPKGKKSKDTLEIENLSKCIAYVNHYKGELTEDFIKFIHKSATNGTLDNLEDCGNYKKIRNWVGNITTSSPEHTPIHMTKLIKWYNDNKDLMEPIELATRFVYGFLCIHPFVDGNGRVSRLLFNFIINQFGYINCIIFDEDKEDYYRSLQNSNKDDVKPLLEFFYKELIKTYDLRISLLNFN